MEKSPGERLRECMALKKGIEILMDADPQKLTLMLTSFSEDGEFAA
ncbi:hypothetical protein A45J_1826 [hot springs metagenome]|uniref:Uncharacterized protein n=1 Tax=hot springs metagenome TaxID=433727 RepID=A0A5J4KWW6_9ZZZZ